MRISVTTFDCYQQYLDAETTALQKLEYDTEGKVWNEDNFVEKRDKLIADTKQALIDRLKGVRFETDAMKRGTEFHEWVLGEAKTDVCGWMSPDLVQNARAAIPPFEHRINEYKVECPFEIEGVNEPIMVVGKADYVMPFYVGELKTTGWFRFETYENSWQWKFYLHLFKVDKVRYHIFELNYKNELKKIEDFYFCEYPNLLWDLNGMVQGLYEFAKANDCLERLTSA